MFFIAGIWWHMHVTLVFAAYDFNLCKWNFGRLRCEFLIAMLLIVQVFWDALSVGNMRVVHTWLGLTWNTSLQMTGTVAHQSTPCITQQRSVYVCHLYGNSWRFSIPILWDGTHWCVENTLQVVILLGICYAVVPSCQTHPNLVRPHQAAYGRSGNKMKSWQCFCCLTVGVGHGIVVQQQHLACPFSFVLLEFMMVCEGVAVYLTFRLFPGEATGTLGYSPCPRKQWPSACQRWKLSTRSRVLS